MESKSDHKGALYVLEGPDGVGKSTIAQELADQLRREGVDVVLLSFPGRERGSLGKLVYALHHDSNSLGVTQVSPTSLQVLHIAAHVDSIDRTIRPAIEDGKTVILDRFWWSAVAYGSSDGVPPETLAALVALEKTAWGPLLPDAAFLITREQPFRAELSPAKWAKVCKAYKRLAGSEREFYPVKAVENSGPFPAVIEGIRKHMSGSLKMRKQRTEAVREDMAPIMTSVNVLRQWNPTCTTLVFDTYWRFAAERQAIFFRRFRAAEWPWTKDSILGEYKFTNAYRASDRVSQFLIHRVIYEEELSPPDMLFRILLFKIFNKIETWELLVRELGHIAWEDFDFQHCDKVLDEALESNKRIYSAAYIMPSGGQSFRHSRKHRNHLELLQMMMRDDLPDRVCAAKSMQELFDLLRRYPTVGDFLAYQYATDINYSPLTDFNEMSFVMPGPGAKDGIRKCFSDPGGLSEADLIRLVADRQQDEFTRLGLHFQDLWGRPLQLIDCQNIFCEVDKYARIAHPEIEGISGRSRIKQKYRVTEEPIEYWYPPKWGINDAVKVSAKSGGTGQRTGALPWNTTGHPSV